MNPDTPLFRVIKSDVLEQGGVLSSGEFQPKEHEDGRISVYDGDLVTADQVYWNYAKREDMPLPRGVLAITQGQCAELGLKVTATPRYGAIGHAHVDVDFNGLTENERVRVAEHLGELALGAGWEFERPFPVATRPRRQR